MRARIVAGDFAAAPVPDPDRLAAEYGVGRRVAQDALALLRSQGWTTGQGRAGTRVRARPPRQEFELSADDPEVRRVVAQLDRQGRRVTRVESIAVARPPTVDEMRRFDIREAMPVVEIVRRYFVGDELVREGIDLKDAERVKIRQVTELPEG